MRGFIILECLIAVSCVMMASALLSMLFVRCFLQSTKLSKMFDRDLELWTIGWYISRDIRSSPTSMAHWDSNSDKMLWFFPKKCGWFLTKNRLWRIEGTSIVAVADNIDTFIFHVDVDHRGVMGVAFSLSKEGVRLSFYAPLQERIISCYS